MQFEFTYIFIPFLFIWNWNDKYVHTNVRSRSFLETHTRFQCFQTKRPKTTTLRGGTYVYGLYKGVPPSPGPNPFHDC